MSQRTSKLKIRGRTWTLKLQAPPRRPSDFGMCDYETRTLYVHPEREPEATLIHEVLHAALPDLTEDAVVELETALTGALATLRKQ